jgi:hypothetical protein
MSFRAAPLGAKLVGDHDAWRPGALLQELSHEASGCVPVAAALNENVNDKAILIDGAP